MSQITPSHAQVVIGGTIAIDNVKTPEAEADNLLGGSAAYAALAAAFHCKPVALVGIVGADFPSEHLAMLERNGVVLDGVERSAHESFTWSGEYHTNMNERTTHKVGLNVLENWEVRIPASIASAPVVVLANMSPDNQIQMLEQTGIIGTGGGRDGRFVVADTMDLWIEIANDRLHDVLPHVDLFVLNEGEARELAGTTNLVKAGREILKKGPRFVVVKLGEFGAMLFSRDGGLFRCHAYPLEAVADPTGAGDTFLGAIAGHIAANGIHTVDEPLLRRAVALGSVLASYTCEAFSTRRLENLTPAELEARMHEFRAASAWE
jgi:sugar/nucleoside kinase (ribokinase family)